MCVVLCVCVRVLLVCVVRDAEGKNQNTRCADFVRGLVCGVVRACMVNACVRVCVTKLKNSERRGKCHRRDMNSSGRQVWRGSHYVWLTPSVGGQSARQIVEILERHSKM